MVVLVIDHVHVVVSDVGLLDLFLWLGFVLFQDDHLLAVLTLDSLFLLFLELPNSSLTDRLFEDEELLVDVVEVGAFVFVERF